MRFKETDVQLQCRQCWRSESRFARVSGTAFAKVRAVIRKDGTQTWGGVLVHHIALKALGRQKKTRPLMKAEQPFPEALYRLTCEDHT